MRDENRDPPPTDTSIVSADPRHSVWTIRPEWIGWFYLLFTLQAVPLIAALWWSENHTGTHDNIASTISTVASGSAALIFVAATASIIELEAVMVLKTLLERHFEKKDREKREAENERDKLRAEFERGIEKGRRLEREQQTARRNVNNGNQED